MEGKGKVVLMVTRKGPEKRSGGEERVNGPVERKGRGTVVPPPPPRPERNDAGKVKEASRGAREPGWPRMAVMVTLGLFFIASGCIFSAVREGGGAAAAAALAAVAAGGSAFFASLYFLYIAPRYGRHALPAFVGFVGGHALLAFFVWKLLA